MIARNIVANHAVGTVLGKPDIAEASVQVVLHSIMNKAVGRDYDPSKVIAAHDIAVKILKSGASLMTSIMAESDKWKRLKMAHDGKLRPDEYTRLYKDVIALYSSDKYADIIIGMAMFDQLTERMSKHELAVIGKRIIEVAGIPVKELSLSFENGKMTTAIRIFQMPEDIHKYQLVALSHFIARKRNVNIVDVWDSVEEIYNKAQSIKKG